VRYILGTGYILETGLCELRMETGLCEVRTGDRDL
jgi:hypothetical protein